MEDLAMQIMKTRTKGICPFSRQKCNDYCELNHDDCAIIEIMKNTNEILDAIYDVLNAIENIKRTRRRTLIDEIRESE